MSNTLAFTHIETGETIDLTPAQLEGLQAEDARRRSPFKNFLQLNERSVDVLEKITLENPVAAALFLFLSKHMSRTNAVVCPYSVMQSVTGKSKSVVFRAIKYLKEKQLIGAKRVGGSTVYHLNAAVVWHSYGKNLKYAELYAAVLLDPKENPKLKVNQGRINVVQAELFETVGEEG